MHLLSLPGLFLFAPNSKILVEIYDKKEGELKHTETMETDSNGYAIFENRVEEQGFSLIYDNLEDKYSKLPHAILTKVICTIMRSIRRHKAGTRGYMDFIQHYIEF